MDRGKCFESLKKHCTKHGFYMNTLSKYVDQKWVVTVSIVDARGNVTISRSGHPRCKKADSLASAREQICLTLDLHHHNPPQPLPYDPDDGDFSPRSSDSGCASPGPDRVDFDWSSPAPLPIQPSLPPAPQMEPQPSTSRQVTPQRTLERVPYAGRPDSEGARRCTESWARPKPQPSIPSPHQLYRPPHDWPWIGESRFYHDRIQAMGIVPKFKRISNNRCAVSFQRHGRENVTLVGEGSTLSLAKEDAFRQYCWQQKWAMYGPKIRDYLRQEQEKKNRKKKRKAEDRRPHLPSADPSQAPVDMEPETDSEDETPSKQRRPYHEKDDHRM